MAEEMATVDLLVFNKTAARNCERIGTDLAWRVGLTR